MRSFEIRRYDDFPSRPAKSIKDNEQMVINLGFQIVLRDFRTEIPGYLNNPLVGLSKLILKLALGSTE